MKKFILALALCCGLAQAQTAYDSSTLVDTNNTSASTSTVNTTNTSTVNSTNTNLNSMSGSVTYNNNNVNTGDMTYTNNNVNSGSVTYTNNNNNVNSGTQTFNNNNSTTSASTSSNSNVNQNINSGNMTNNNISDITQRVIQPPPTAIAPAMMSGGNQDLCTTGTSGSVQTQIFGVSTGGTVRDENCERLKLSKTLYDMGMKVAAVSTMCQDRRVWEAMMSAGTPCPIDGKIGTEAKALWDSNPSRVPLEQKAKNDDTYKKIGMGGLLGVLVYNIFNR